MAKKIVKPAVKKNAEQETFANSFSVDSVLPQKYHTPAVIALILILFLIFLNPLYFGGKSFQSGDIIASESMQPYLAKDRDGFTLWNPHIFCGMPAYSIAVGYTWFNLVYVGITEARNIFTAFFSVDYAKWSFYLILFGITSFLLMRHLTRSTMISLFTALATVFSTGIIVFLYIGHVTKLTSLCMFPIIFLMLLRMQKKFSLLDFVLLAIALQILIQGFHVQIIFYLLLAVGLYYAYYLARSVIKKDGVLRNNLLKSLGLLVIAVGIGLAIQSDNFTQVYEYTPYSTRGTKSIGELTTGTTEKAQSDYYEYHTNWSFSPGEVMTFIVPSYYGFGSSVYNGELSQNRDVEVNTYFGQMPFVDVAMYMGVAVFFLALYGMFTRFKEPLVQFLSLLTVFSLFLSFGKNLSFLYDLFFYYFPYFDKFRVPSMILVLVQFAVPILAGLGLQKIVATAKEKDARAEKILQYAAFVFSGLFIIFLLANQAAGSWFIERAQQSPQSEQLRPIFDYMSSMFTADLLLAFLFLSIVFWAGWLTTKRKISGDVFAILVIVVTLIDLWRIDARGAKYTDAPDKGHLFVEPEYIKKIKEMKETEPFRILNLKQDQSLGSVQQNSNFNAYFLMEDFYGYSAIKPRAYQDMMDVISPANPTLWRMANVKYIVLDQPQAYPGFELVGQFEKAALYRNTTALPRYYFVDSIAQKNGMATLQAIKNNEFDPARVAFLEDAPPAVQKTDSTAAISLVKYADEKTELNVRASGNNYLVFATTYHPKGWSATVDGQSVPIYRTNHAFMGIVVPKGNHKVEFVYAPESFTIAKYASLSLSSLLVLGLIAGIFIEYRNRKKGTGE